MMINKIIYFLRGYLLISIRGNALERFIDQIINSDIVLRNLKRVRRDYFRAEIEIEDFAKLRPLVRKRLCKVRIIKKIGLPFIVKRARMRIFLLTGFLIFILIFWLGSSYLWFIEIDGLEHINKYKVINHLNNYGIEAGAKKENINLNNIENRLLNDFSDIVWINARWQGTRLYIEIVEKKKVKQEKSYDIVAKKDGIISEMIVLSGEPVVKEGDTVTEGEKLIVGITDEDGIKQKARGIVNAEVWYNVSGITEIKHKEYIFSGRSKKRYGINISGYSLLLPPGDPVFSKYVKRIISKELLKWRKIGFALELIKEENIEFETFDIIRSEEATLYNAKKDALRKLFTKLESGCSIKTVYIDNYNKENNKLSISLLIKTEENIASKEEDFCG